MNKPFIIGLSASNRSMLSTRDESRLTQKISSDLTDADFAIPGPGSDNLSRSLEINEGLLNDLSAKYLTNSETALLIALTSAKCQGAEIAFLSLKNLLDKYSKSPSAKKRVQDMLARSSGIIISSPVYFGDRSSLVQRFLELLYGDPILAGTLANKIITGISVGAKRNGGQETLLIYQLLDFLEFNMLGVGNDSKSTSQYGGTCTAGEVGTILNDSYGIYTSQGTGRRITNVARLYAASAEGGLRDKLKVGFFILQDSKARGAKLLAELTANFSNTITPQLFDITKSHIEPCRACKYCPSVFGYDENYRCIVKNKKDFFLKKHAAIVDLDAIVMVMFSPKNKKELNSMYQLFIERTRYLRRSDYVYSNIPFMPLIFEEVNGNQNFHIRIITSFIRQETIVAKPAVGILHNNKLLNGDYLKNSISRFVELAEKITIGRLKTSSQENCFSLYNPVGYTLKYNRDFKKNNIDIRNRNLERRCHILQEKMSKRLI